METLTEVLPETKSSKHSAIRWTPAEADYSPVCGLLVIDTDRARVEYLVSEHSPGWDGRAFTFTKLVDGAKGEPEHYSLFIARNGQDFMCECRGFQAHGHCKHLHAALALIRNQWL